MLIQGVVRISHVSREPQVNNSWYNHFQENVSPNVFDRFSTAIDLCSGVFGGVKIGCRNFPHHLSTLSATSAPLVTPLSFFPANPLRHLGPSC